MCDWTDDIEHSEEWLRNNLAEAEDALAPWEPTEITLSSDCDYELAFDCTEYTTIRITNTNDQPFTYETHCIICSMLLSTEKECYRLHQLNFMEYMEILDDGCVVTIPKCMRKSNTKIWFEAFMRNVALCYTYNFTIKFERIHAINLGGIVPFHKWSERVHKGEILNIPNNVNTVKICFANYERLELIKHIDHITIYYENEKPIIIDFDDLAPEYTYYTIVQKSVYAINIEELFPHRTSDAKIMITLHNDLPDCGIYVYGIAND